jgi:hypothetical protein
MSHTANVDASNVPGANTTPLVCLSIVSHGHGPMVELLLEDLRALRWPRESFDLLLTINTPEDTHFVDRFADLPLKLIRNQRPLGFGANHNAAFKHSSAPYFAVVNPDVRLPELNLSAWLAPMKADRVAACAPLARDSQGALQDNARHFPILPSLMRRVLTGKREPGYALKATPQIIDWAAGYFLLFKRVAFAQVSGFDERYFMYLEDVDIAARLKQQGWQVVWDCSVSVIHNAQRASHRQWRHVAWHLRSMARYLSR